MAVRYVGALCVAAREGEVEVPVVELAGGVCR